MSPLELFSCRFLPKRGQNCYIPARPQSLNGSQLRKLRLAKEVGDDLKKLYGIKV